MLATTKATKQIPAAAPACSHRFSFISPPCRGPCCVGPSAWRIRLPPYAWKGDISGHPSELVRKAGFSTYTPSGDAKQGGRLRHPVSGGDVLVDDGESARRVEILVQTGPDTFEARRAGAGGTPGLEPTRAFDQQLVTPFPRLAVVVRQD